MMPTVRVLAYFGYLRPRRARGKTTNGVVPLWFRYQIVAEVRSGDGTTGNRRYVVIGETWTKRAAVLAVDDLRAACTATNQRAQEADRG